MLHPYDWEDVELQKVPAMAVHAGVQRGHRRPGPGLASAGRGDPGHRGGQTFLTGAFGLGAKIYDRQQANVRIAEQHATSSSATRSPSWRKSGLVRQFLVQNPL